MNEARVTLIISMVLALGFSAYITIRLQNAYITTPRMTESVVKTTKSLDPVKKWEAVRSQRAHDLNKAHEQGISHAQLIIKKCDCPHLAFDETRYKPDTQEKALAIWRYLECKKACDNAKITATTTP